MSQTRQAKVCKSHFRQGQGKNIPKMKINSRAKHKHVE